MSRSNQAHRRLRWWDRRYPRWLHEHSWRRQDVAKAASVSPADGPYVAGPLHEAERSTLRSSTEQRRRARSGTPSGPFPLPPGQPKDRLYGGRPRTRNPVSENQGVGFRFCPGPPPLRGAMPFAMIAGSGFDFSRTRSTAQALPARMPASGSLWPRPLQVCIEQRQELLPGASRRSSPRIPALTLSPGGA